MAVRQLIGRFLSDPIPKQLWCLSDLTSSFLGQWAGEYGVTHEAAFGHLLSTAFRHKHLGQGLTPAYANRDLSAKRRAWNWGHAKGYLPPSEPGPTAVVLEEPSAKEVRATAEKLAAILEASDHADPAASALVQLLVGMGARLSDVLAVKLRDVNQRGGDVAIRGQKAGRRRSRCWPGGRTH